MVGSYYYNLFLIGFWYFVAMSLSCSYIRVHDIEKESATCRSCRNFDKLSESITYLEVDITGKCKLPTQLFEREKLNSLVVISKELFFPDKRVHSSLDTLGIYDPEFDEFPSFIGNLNNLSALIIFLNGENAVRSLATSDMAESLSSLNVGLTNADSIPSELLNMSNLSTLRVFSKDDKTMYLSPDVCFPKHFETLSLPIDGMVIFNAFSEFPNLKTLQIKSLSSVDTLISYLPHLHQLKEICIEDIDYITRLEIEKKFPNIIFKCRDTFFYPESWE